MMRLLTGVDEGRADELAGDPLAEELGDAVDDGGAEVVEVEHVLAHEHHRALEPRILARPRQPVDDPAQHLRRPQLSTPRPLLYPVAFCFAGATVRVW